ncbi:MAG TPA: LptE family protein [Verrucomicrobiae bacterium]
MRLLKLILPLILVAGLAGCASYHLGPAGEPAGEKTISIQPFNNQTLQPRLGDALSQAVRERIQSDGTYHLSTHGQADVVISGVIVTYKRIAMGYTDTDASTPENYRVELTVHVVARDTTAGKVLLDRDVKAHTLVHIGQDLASAERQALPLIAADFANNVTELLTEGAW